MLNIIKFASFSKEILAWIKYFFIQRQMRSLMVRRILRVQMPGAKNDNRNVVHYRKKNRKLRSHDPLFPLWGRAAPYSRCLSSKHARTPHYCTRECREHY